MRATLLAALTILGAGLEAAPPSHHNVVPNHDFESGDQGVPSGWTNCNGVTVKWEDDGNPGRCLQLNTNVSPKEAASAKNTPPPAGGALVPHPPANPLKTVGAGAGVASWSEPIPVEPGATYRMTADVRGPGGKPFVYLKGFQRLDAEEAARHGTLRFFRRHPGGPSFSLMVGGEEQRQPQEGDYLQTFRARLVCRVAPNDSWKHFERTVKIPTRKEYAAEVVMLMLFAYYPPGTYAFDNVQLIRLPDSAE